MKIPPKTIQPKRVSSDEVRIQKYIFIFYLYGKSLYFFRNFPSTRFSPARNQSVIIIPILRCQQHIFVREKGRQCVCVCVLRTFVRDKLHSLPTASAFDVEHNGSMRTPRTLNGTEKSVSPKKLKLKMRGSTELFRILAKSCKIFQRYRKK